jgi:hypothetical protein
MVSHFITPCLSRVTLQRPDKLRVIKLGDGIPDEFYYDGKTISAYVPSTDLIAVADAPPTIDQMLDAAWHVGAIYFPFGDVIASNPCAVFEKLTSAFYVANRSWLVARRRTWSRLPGMAYRRNCGSGR